MSDNWIDVTSADDVPEDDVIGIDSPHDYDPVWQKCRELKIAPSFHNGARSILLRNSPSNFCYNHIGHFASAGHAVAKALFFGGVTRRFPDLNFAFLEGGVGWGCQLFADLMEHWERRNARALENMRPDKLDRKLLMEMVEKYGYKEHAAALRAADVTAAGGAACSSIWRRRPR